jgi:hypothetical protein
VTWTYLYGERGIGLDLPAAILQAKERTKNREKEHETKKNRTNNNQNTAHNGQTHHLKETAKMIDIS